MSIHIKTESNENITAKQVNVFDLTKNASKLPSDFLSLTTPKNIVLTKKHMQVIEVLTHKNNNIDILVSQIGWSRSKYQYQLRCLKSLFKCSKTTDLLCRLFQTQVIVLNNS